MPASSFATPHVCVAIAGGICLSILAARAVRSRKVPPPTHMLKGRHVVITGASSGIGREAARILVSEGAIITAAGRDEHRTRSCIPSDSASASSSSFTFLPLDLGSLQSVRDFAKKLRALNQPIDVLILNAGIYNREQCCTMDGFEQTLQVNHLSNFLLVQEIWDLLIANRTRVVVLSSSLHRKVAKLSLSEMMSLHGDYNGYKRYSETKLLNILFTKELARRFGSSGATAVSVRPGFIPTTSLFRTELMHRPWLRFLLPFVSLVTTSVTDGAHAVLYAAFEPKITNGALVHMGGEETPSALAQDGPLAVQLWELSKRQL